MTVVERSGTWVDHAVCRGVETAVFFPGPYDAAMVSAAKALCASCPVTRECLIDALVQGDWQDGVRGGYTARERRDRKRELTGYADAHQARRAVGRVVDRRRAVS